MKNNFVKVLLFGCFCFLATTFNCYAGTIKSYDSEIEMAYNCSEPSIFENQGKVVYYYDNNGKLIRRDLCEDEILEPNLECDFDGWYYDITYTKKVTATNEKDMVTKETYDVDGDICYGRFGVKVYAKCKDEPSTPVCSTNIDKNYKVHYIVDGKEVQSKTFIYGNNESLNIDYNVSENKTFDGWYIDSSYTNKLTSLTTDKLTIIVKKDDNNCTIGYNDVYLYAKLNDITKECPNIENMEYVIHYIVDGEEVDTDVVTRETNKELKKIDISNDCTISDWYLDEDLNVALISNKISDIGVTSNLDIDNCVISYNDVYVYAATTCPVYENPNTGDKIVIYFVGGFILISCGIVVTKKILNK